MQLKRIQIKRFRSIDNLKLNLKEGLNVFTGPNNSGKSNILRAVALSLDPNSVQPFTWKNDLPHGLEWGRPGISLDFSIDERKTTEKTLLRYVKEYEKSIPDISEKVFADDGFIRLSNQYKGNISLEPKNEKYFLSPKGTIKGDDKKLNKAIKKFDSITSFVYIQSGESLSSLLERGFHDILRDVLKEKLSKQFSLAEEKRKKFEEEIKDVILSELCNHVRDEIANIIPEITEIEIKPNIPTINDIIANSEIKFKDEYLTSIDNKGTGVRSAFLINLLSFIAASTTKNIVFAIEEPESFIHPAAQSKLIQTIIKISNRENITVLLTTHSPFILNEIDESRVFIIQKTINGKTEMFNHFLGDETACIDQALEILIGNKTIPKTFDKIRNIGNEKKCILIVEGFTDKRYIELALEKNNKSEEFENIHIFDCKGVYDVLLNTILFKQFFMDELKVITLLDYDESGNRIYDLLTKHLRYQGKKEVIRYSQYKLHHNADVEAEDLFPKTLLTKFLKKYDDKEILAEKTYRPGKPTQYHYGLKPLGKDQFLKWLPNNSKKSDYRLWIKVINDIHKKIE